MRWRLKWTGYWLLTSKLWVRGPRGALKVFLISLGFPLPSGIGKNQFPRYIPPRGMRYSYNGLLHLASNQEMTVRFCYIALKILVWQHTKRFKWVWGVYHKNFHHADVAQG